MQAPQWAVSQRAERQRERERERERERQRKRFQNKNKNIVESKHLYIHTDERIEWSALEVNIEGKGGHTDSQHPNDAISLTHTECKEARQLSQ